jgi:hypothetical protein
VREDVRRGTSDQGVRHAVVILRSQVAPLPRVPHLGSEPGRASPIEAGPLLLALRI